MSYKNLVSFCPRNGVHIIIIVVIILTILGVGTLVTLSNKTKKDLKIDELNTKPNNNSEEENQDSSVLEANSNILVVYFSKTGENYGVGTVEVGNTALMANYIKDYLNADIFEIIPVKEYPNDYKTATEIAKTEQEQNARPKIKNKLENLNSYDTIFIGYPIWWGDLPMIVYTFLESYDFRGIKIIPFNTHEGSRNAGTYNTIKSKLKTSNVETNGLAIQGKVARTDEGKTRTINWLKELGY